MDARGCECVQVRGGAAGGHGPRLGDTDLIVGDVGREASQVMVDASRKVLDDGGEVVCLLWPPEPAAVTRVQIERRMRSALVQLLHRVPVHACTEV